jgi:hypothetical protein
VAVRGAENRPVADPPADIGLRRKRKDHSSTSTRPPFCQGDAARAATRGPKGLAVARPAEHVLDALRPRHPLHLAKHHVYNQ